MSESRTDFLKQNRINFLEVVKNKSHSVRKEKEREITIERGYAKGKYILQTVRDYNWDK